MINRLWDPLSRHQPLFNSTPITNANVNTSNSVPTAIMVNHLHNTFPDDLLRMINFPMQEHETKNFKISFPEIWSTKQPSSDDLRGHSLLSLNDSIRCDISLQSISGDFFKLIIQAFSNKAVRDDFQSKIWSGHENTFDGKQKLKDFEQIKIGIFEINGKKAIQFCWSAVAVKNFFSDLQEDRKYFFQEFYLPHDNRQSFIIQGISDFFDPLVIDCQEKITKTFVSKV